jgi:iron complex transport system substrate-binding protein
MVTIGHSLATETLNTVYISGQHDFYNDLIDIAGATNVYQSDTPRVPTLSLEGILALNPDVIIDIFPESDDHNANLEQVMSHWLSLSSINAVKQHRVHLIEESYATIPGPRVSLLLEQFVNLIHPDIDWTDFPR